MPASPETTGIAQIGRLWVLAALPPLAAIFVGGSASLIGNAIAFAVTPTDWWSHGLFIGLSGVCLVIALRAARRTAREGGPRWLSRAIPLLMASGFTFGAWAGGQLLEARRASFERIANTVCKDPERDASADPECLKAAKPCIRTAWRDAPAHDQIEPRARACVQSARRN